MAWTKRPALLGAHRQVAHHQPLDELRRGRRARGAAGRLPLPPVDVGPEGGGDLQGLAAARGQAAPEAVPRGRTTPGGDRPEAGPPAPGRSTKPVLADLQHARAAPSRPRAARRRADCRWCAARPGRRARRRGRGARCDQGGPLARERAAGPPVSRAPGRASSSARAAASRGRSASASSRTVSRMSTGRSAVAQQVVGRRRWTRRPSARRRAGSRTGRWRARRRQWRSSSSKRSAAVCGRGAARYVGVLLGRRRAP